MPPRLPIYLSIAAALATLALKWTAYYLTGSVGLFSDAVESGINLLAAVTAFLSLLYASKPVDPSHTYGHEKIEYFSSGLEGTLIVAAAGGIAWYAVLRLVTPQTLEALDIGAGIALFASVINFAVATLLLRTGRKYHSIILEADGKHLMTDVWTSVAVVAGLGLTWLTGRSWLDPVLALLVSANITWTGVDLMRRSFDGLMDHALPEEEQARVRSAIESQLKQGMDYHALRTRRAGARRFVDFHLLVPGAWTVRWAHEVTGRVEDALRQALPGMEITVHIEPIEAQEAWEDSALLPVEEAQRAVRREENHGV